MTITNERGIFATAFLGPKFEETPTSQQRSDTQETSVPVPPSWSEQAPLVTADEALTLAPVYRAVSIISTAVSQLDFGVYRGNQEAPELLLNSADNTWPYKSLVMQPDSNKSLSDFLKRTAVCLSTQGNAFWRIYANSAGLPKQVEVLNPLQVLVRYSDTGVKFYDYNGYANRGTVTLKDSEVKHLRLMEVPNRVLGLGPIEAGRDTIRALLDLQDYQATFLSDGGVPNGLLSTDEDLDSELAGKYQSKWYENLKVGKTAVLGRGVKYQALTVNPQEALFTEQVTAGITAVARVFGIPAHLLIAAVEGNSMTYMNLVTSDTVFVRYGLKEYLTAIEDAFSELLPRGTSVRLLTDEWLRGDDRSRSDVATKNLTSGVWTINEARAYTGKSPIANGDALAPQTSATTTEGDAQAA